MSNLQKIEQAVSQLSSSELITFRNWFAEFDAERWDRQAEVKTKELVLEI